MFRLFIIAIVSPLHNRNRLEIVIAQFMLVTLNPTTDQRTIAIKQPWHPSVLLQLWAAKQPCANTAYSNNNLFLIRRDMTYARDIQRKREKKRVGEKEKGEGWSWEREGERERDCFPVQSRSKRQQTLRPGHWFQNLVLPLSHPSSRLSVKNHGHNLLWWLKCKVCIWALIAHID